MKRLKIALSSAVVCFLTLPLASVAQSAVASAAPGAPVAAPGPSPTGYVPVAGKKKLEYAGPKTLVELPATPMLDEEGRQRLDPDGKPLFNPPAKQQRDKHGNPLFDASGKPVMQTASDPGYDEKGKKIHAKKEKQPKMVSVSIERGTLTIDGMTGKAGLNYDIKDFKYLYLYAPWIGTTIVSSAPFPGATEQKNAFADNTLTVTVQDHTLQVYSDKRLLGKKAESAWVAVDRSYQMPTKFPVVGYGETLHAPYVWPGSRENAVAKGALAPPPLPDSLRASGLLAPCPAGQMRPAASAASGASACVPVPTPVAATAAGPAASMNR